MNLPSGGKNGRNLPEVKSPGTLIKAFPALCSNFPGEVWYVVVEKKEGKKERLAYDKNAM